MKFIIMIVSACIYLFPAVQSCAEYYEEPYGTLADTMAPVAGKYWKLWVPPYGAPDWFCRTDKEVGEFLTDNPYGQTALNDEMGPCEKCEEYEYSLLPYNGDEVCIHYKPCPDGWEFMNYNDRDGCFQCPDNYVFNNDGACEWAGLGQPPEAPKNMKASDGKKDVVTVRWDKVPGATFYLVHASRVINAKTTGTVFYDREAISNFKYLYKVRACNPLGCGAWSTDYGFMTASSRRAVQFIYPIIFGSEND